MIITIIQFFITAYLLLALGLAFQLIVKSIISWLDKLRLK